MKISDMKTGNNFLNNLTNMSLKQIRYQGDNRISKRNSQSGAVLVEFALIFPIIILISFSAFEYTRAIQGLSVAASASKEMANITLRECSDTLEDFEIRACIDQKLIDFQENYLQTVKPGIKLIVNFLRPLPIVDQNGNTIGYRWNNIQSSFSAPITSETPETYNYSPTSKVGSLFNEDGQLKSNFMSLDRHQVIILAEAYYPYRPVLNFLKSFFSLPVSEEGVLYDATII